MWIKSCMSITPLLLKSNWPHHYPVKGGWPNACKSNSKSIMNVLTYSLYGRCTVKVTFLSKNFSFSSGVSVDMIPSMAGRTSVCPYEP